MPSPTQSKAFPIYNYDEGGSVPSGVTGLSINSDGAQRYEAFQHRRIFLNNLSISTTDATTSGAYGSQKIYDLPDGLVTILGAQVTMTAAARGSTGITTTATVKFSLGTAAESTNDTLDSTQANIVASTSMSAFVSGSTTTETIGVSSSVVLVNGTSTAGDIFLNIGIADAGSTASDSVTLSGYIDLLFCVVSDNTTMARA